MVFWSLDCVLKKRRCLSQKNPCWTWAWVKMSLGPYVRRMGSQDLDRWLDRIIPIMNKPWMGIWKGSHNPILSGLTLDIQGHYDYREYTIARLQKNYWTPSSQYPSLPVVSSSHSEREEMWVWNPLTPFTSGGIFVDTANTSPQKVWPEDYKVGPLLVINWSYKPYKWPS